MAAASARAPWHPTWAALCTLGDSLVVATAKGMLLKYDVDAVRETARATMGVKALKLRDDDELATARVVAPDKDHVLVLTAAGYGKRVDVEAVRARSRATMGVQAIKFKKEGDVLVDVTGVLAGSWHLVGNRLSPVSGTARRCIVWLQLCGTSSMF